MTRGHKEGVIEYGIDKLRRLVQRRSEVGGGGWCQQKVCASRLMKEDV